MGCQQGLAIDTQLLGQRQMARLDGLEFSFAFAGNRFGNKGVEEIGDGRDGRVNDEGALALGLHGFDAFGDHTPISQRFNAGAAKFQDDPILRMFHVQLSNSLPLWGKARAYLLAVGSPIPCKTCHGVLAVCRRGARVCPLSATQIQA